MNEVTLKSFISVYISWPPPLATTSKELYCLHQVYLVYSFVYLCTVVAYEPDSDPAVIASSLTQLLSEAEPPSTSHDKEVSQ